MFLDSSRAEDQAVGVEPAQFTWQFTECRKPEGDEAAGRRQGTTGALNGVQSQGRQAVRHRVQEAHWQDPHPVRVASKLSRSVVQAEAAGGLVVVLL